jgi:hypothetical protein
VTRPSSPADRRRLPERGGNGKRVPINLDQYRRMDPADFLGLREEYAGVHYLFDRIAAEQTTRPRPSVAGQPFTERTYNRLLSRVVKDAREAAHAGGGQLDRDVLLLLLEHTVGVLSPAELYSVLEVASEGARLAALHTVLGSRETHLETGQSILEALAHHAIGHDVRERLGPPSPRISPSP